MDSLLSIKVFAASVELGSFSAAATRFGMTSQMAGRHVQALEESLGVRLLNRSTRAQSLTEAGRIYYQSCSIVLLELDSAQFGLQQLQSEPSGLLRVSAATTHGSYCVAPVVADFLRTYPKMSVELELSDRIVDLVGDGYDFAIRIGDISSYSVIARPLQAYELLMCATPSYLEQAPPIGDLADLNRHFCLRYTYSNRPKSKTVTFFRGDHRFEIEFPARLSVNSITALRNAALQTGGVVVGPSIALNEDIRAGRLQRVLAHYKIPSRPVHLIYMPDRRTTPGHRSFIDFMTKRLGIKTRT